MATTTVSFEELEQDARRVKKASEMGPVFITESGRPASVLLSIEEYRKLSGDQGDTVDPIAYPEGPEIKFDRSRMTVEEYRKLTGHLPSLADMLAGLKAWGTLILSRHGWAGFPTASRISPISR